MTITLFYRRFKGGHAPTGNTEYVKETVPETLGFGVFRTFVGPFTGKGQGAIAYFIPGERHFLSFWGGNITRNVKMRCWRDCKIMFAIAILFKQGRLPSPF